MPWLFRYNWQPLQAPSACACGTKFSIEHALSCPKGGSPSIRHNEIRDIPKRDQHVHTYTCTL